MMLRLCMPVAALATLVLPVHAGDTDKLDFFERRIRPILAERCYDCHGPETAEGGLRLDVRSGWQRGGERGPAIVPGDPAASLLIRAVTGRDSGLRMPPEDSEPLTAQQTEDLMRWIRDGAVDPRTGQTVVSETEKAARSHWAFSAPVWPQFSADQTGQNPIDILIDRQLQRAGLVATGPADMQALVRRAVYDLHGLPPTVEQLQTARDDFPALIDSLLASPRYGERWGRHWLDVARYSDAKDGVLMYGDARIRPFAYTYRDYVIRAFNEDKPLVDFIREQLAADQLGLADNAPELAALGFLTLGRMFDRNRHDVIDDQIDVVTRGFLGLTVTCARCHDHKFDAIPTADYYSLYGVFASSVEPLQRPQIEPVTAEGEAFEAEYASKLAEVLAARDQHYNDVLKQAREQTPEYLVHVATTEPDLAETAIFFLSLTEDQLRPQITSRWRRLLEQRAFPDDPIFGPWHDLMKSGRLQPDIWRKRGIHPEIIDALVSAQPKTPEQVARVYGHVIRDAWRKIEDSQQQAAALMQRRAALKRESISLADIVAGGDGLASGSRGRGIHPETGAPTEGATGFIDSVRPNQVIPVAWNRFVDCVFVPSGTSAEVSTTGVTVEGLTQASGRTWNYFCDAAPGAPGGTTIGGVDFVQEDRHLLNMHTNKGITFDLDELRRVHEFTSARFRATVANIGQRDKSRLNVAVFLDGQNVASISDLKSQRDVHEVDVCVPADCGFLTLVTMEGTDGISHDQAVFGDPRIVPDRNAEWIQHLTQELEVVSARHRELLQQGGDSGRSTMLSDLLLSRESPVWFPPNEVQHYMERRKRDAFLGTVNQLDSIAVRHPGAAARAMVLVDSERLCDPVIFQRGDPTARGNPVPRRFLRLLSPQDRPAFPNGSGRLDLANAIADRQNPLTARVWVNRVWMHHFGSPLVDDPADFGLRAERPVQHELLDFLALYFMEHGWRTMPLHRLIMQSKAWQRASVIDWSERWKQQADRDPENRFFWRAGRRRLDLEQMRDTILFLSGQLDNRMYGRPGLITDLNNGRRTVYAFVERQNIPNIVQVFDFANADSSTSRRVTTTVPQQALFAMNSEFMKRAVDRLAGRIAAAPPDEQVRQLYSIVFCREPTARELRMTVEFLNAGSVRELAHVLLMSNELMFVD